MKNNKQPEIRFPGFTENWERRELGSITQIYDGTHQTPNYKTQGVMFLSVENIKTLSSEKYISEDDFDKNFKVRPEKNDVLMTRIGDIGTANVVKSDEKIAYYVSLALFKSKELNPYFLVSNIHSPHMQNELWKRTLHIAFPKKINKNEIAKVSIKFPSLEEQVKIGSFFKQLADAITLHQQELTTLKQTKKGFLEKMFPKEGEKVPEIRFPGFTEEWEQRKLEDISDKVTEKNKNNEFFETLTNSAEFGIINQRDFFDKDISNEKNLNGYYIVREDDFVYNPRISNFAPVGPVKRNKLGRTGVMSPLYYVFRTYDIDKTYLEFYFNTAKWHKFMKLNGDSGARSDRFAIKDSILKNMPIPFPSFNEQKKIGFLFQKLDNAIALHQRELELLQNTKKAFLQKMFV